MCDPKPSMIMFRPSLLFIVSTVLFLLYLATISTSYANQTSLLLNTISQQLNQTLSKQGKLGLTLPFHSTRRFAFSNQAINNQGLITIQASGKIIYQRQGEHATRYVINAHQTPQYPLLYQLTQTLRHLLQQQTNELQQDYQVNLIGTAQEWSLILTPKQSTVTDLQDIHLNGNQTQIKAIALQQNNGNRWSWRFSNPIKKPLQHAH